MHDVRITIPRNFINIYGILNYSHPTNCRHWQPIPLKHQQSCIVHVLLKIKMMFQKLTRQTTWFVKFPVYSFFVNSFIISLIFYFYQMRYFFSGNSVIKTNARAVDLPAFKHVYIEASWYRDNSIITILLFLSVLIPTEYLEDKHF